MTKVKIISGIIIGGLAAIVIVAIASGVFFLVKYNDYWRFASDTGLSPWDAVEIYEWPNEHTEWIMSLSNAAADEDWDRLDELTKKDRHSYLGSYFRNLSKAMKGELSTCLMDYYAPFEKALFIPVTEKAGRFPISNSGEVWYQLGEMTMAEHSAILGLILSKNQNGSRYLQRLGDINRIWGDEQAAGKYFHLLGKGSSLDEEKLEFKRSLLPGKDFVHTATDYRCALKALLEANPGNLPAYEYLVCLDLLIKDLDAFIQDFNPAMPVSRIYQEAGLIWMSVTGDHSMETAGRFHLDESILNDFKQFSSLVDKQDTKQLRKLFGRSYWFYFKYAARNDKN